MLEERLASDFGALDALAVEVAFDHHLRRNSRMVGADDPECILAKHPFAAGEDVLQRDVERVADMERAGDVWRRHDDRPRLRLGAVGAKLPFPLPMLIPALLDRRWLEGLGKVGHAPWRLAVVRRSINTNTSLRA